MFRMHCELISLQAELYNEFRGQKIRQSAETGALPPSRGTLEKHPTHYSGRDSKPAHYSNTHKPFLRYLIVDQTPQAARL